MSAIEWICQTIKSWRLYIWIFGFACVGAGLRILPANVQNVVCQAYTTHVEARLGRMIDEFFRIHGPAGTPGAPAEDPETVVSAGTTGVFNSDLFKKTIRDYICPGTPAFAPMAVADIPQILGGSITLAFLAVLSIPRRNPFITAASVRESTESQAVAAPDYRLNRRLHVGIAYAFASCLACVFFPPNFVAVAPFDWRQQMPHLLALVVAAIFGAAWGTLRFQRTNAPCWTVAIHIAFAGVFLSGLIALLIALPYRMMTTVDAARLPLDQVKTFTGIRLVALPVVAAATSVVLLAALRKIHRMPLRFLPEAVQLSS